jgi:hypothetical protein
MSEELKPITAADEGFDADEPNTRGIFIFLVATVAMFAAVVVGVSYYYNSVYEETVYEEVMAPASQQLASLHAREDWNLTHYGYLDKAKGQVRIPIDRAMELLTEEAAAGKLRYQQNDQPVKKVEPAAQMAAPAAAAPASGR